jgi:predicted AAA+ superfamily ATPase
MTLVERGLASPTVSLSALLDGSSRTIAGATEVDLRRYVQEILGSGFPAIRPLTPSLQRAQLDGYLDRIVERDFEELGHQVRRPGTLMRWMRAYAAATATTASYEKIRDAASSGVSDKPSKTATLPYRDVLERLWILDPLPAWLPSHNHLARLAAPAKHHLADPALAARLLDVDADALLGARHVHPTMPRDGTLLGALFESLVTLCVRVYAEAAQARTAHLRTWKGEREVDLIVERGTRVLALEVKLGRAPDDSDVRHLLWLRDRLGDDLADAAVITTGTTAYRRRDGIAVVPAALLGP